MPYDIKQVVECIVWQHYFVYYFFADDKAIITKTENALHQAIYIQFVTNTTSKVLLLKQKS